MPTTSPSHLEPLHSTKSVDTFTKMGEHRTTHSDSHDITVSKDPHSSIISTVQSQLTSTNQSKEVRPNNLYPNINKSIDSLVETEWRHEKQAGRNLNCLTINAEGLSNNIPYILEISKDLDIILIQEHWLFNCEQFKISQLLTGYLYKATSVDDTNQISSVAGQSVTEARKRTY